MNQQNANTVGEGKVKPDVLDADRFEKFQRKRHKWVSWLSGEDHHAIWNQITSLHWDYTLFLTLNDLRNEAAQNPVAGVGFNGPVLRLLDAGFVATQAIGIRRLTERQWNNVTKRVISLQALVDGIKDSRELLTREVYLASHGLPYDFAAARSVRDEQLIATGSFASYKGIDPAPDESERMHACFDRLSETTPTGRSREDFTSAKWFDRLDSKLSSCEDVCIFADKFIAHAADPTSRSRLTAAQEGITLARLAECHQALVQVAEFVGCRILQCSAGASVPTPQFDPVENLDKAWTGVRDFEKGEGKAGEFWERNWQSVKQWESEALRRFEQGHA